MTEYSFLMKIDIISERLWYRGIETHTGTCICYNLYFNLGSKFKLLFSELFKPSYLVDERLWFGSCSDFPNQETRFIALELFANYCLTEGILNELL